MTNEFKARVFEKMQNIIPRTREKIIETDHIPLIVEISFAQMAANKAASTGN